MKKITALLLTVVLVVSVLTSCGVSKNNKASDKNVAADESLSGEITFWHSFTQGTRMEALENAVDKFENMYPNVKINMNMMSWADFKKR